MERSPETGRARPLPMPVVLAILAACTVVLGLVPAPGAAAVESAAAGDPPLVYTACPQEECGIFVRDPDGGERRLTDDDGHQGPEWSPDGREVAFVHRDAGLFAVGADGEGERQLSADLASIPTWSPDGRWIAFRRGEPGAGFAGELAVVPADGSEGLVLLDQVGAFAWAPDGQRLAAVPNSSFEEPDELVIVGVDGEVERTITPAEPHLGDLAWSPDGAHLAYSASDLAGGRFSTWRTYVVAADGTDTRRVGGEDARPRPHSWSPDGTRLAVQRLVDQSTTHTSFDVDVVDVATGAVLSEIGFTGRTVFNPVWSAAGDRLYLTARDDVFEDPPADGLGLVDPDGEGRSGVMVTGMQGEHARDLHTGGRTYAVGPDVGTCPDVAWYDVGHAPVSDRDTIPPVHRTAVDCAAHHEIVQGFADGSFRPALDVRRDQMASFVAGTLDAAGVALPEGGDADFVDVPADSPHARAINRLAAAGVVRGGPGDLPAEAYGPGLPVRRDQMAAFLVRAVQEATGEQWTSQTQRFDDVPPASTHFAVVNGAAEHGLAAGFADGTFRPDAGVRRDQTASFAVRLLAALAGQSSS